MTDVGGDVATLEQLALACVSSAQELAALRKGVEATFAEVGETSDIPAGLREVEAWLSEQASDIRWRAQELAEADRRSIPQAFGAGVGAGVRGLVDGARGLLELSFATQMAPVRLLRAALGGRSGLSDLAAEDYTRSAALTRGIVSALVDFGQMALQFNIVTGPLLFTQRTQRDGIRQTLDAYAFDAGEQIPDLALTLVTIGAGRALRAGRLALVRDEVVDLRLPATPGVVNAGWTLPERGGAWIGGRWYTEHALERMAPRTPEVMAQLEARAMGRAAEVGVRPGTWRFKEWWADNRPDPRGVPPSVVQAELRKPGSTDVEVVVNDRGDVVTVLARR